MGAKRPGPTQTALQTVDKPIEVSPRSEDPSHRAPPASARPEAPADRPPASRPVSQSQTGTGSTRPAIPAAHGAESRLMTPNFVPVQNGFGVQTGAPSQEVLRTSQREAIPSLPAKEHREPPVKPENPEGLGQGNSVVRESVAPYGAPSEESGWKRPKEPPGYGEQPKAMKPQERRTEEVKIALIPPGPISSNHIPPLPVPHVGPRLTPPVARVAIVIDDFGLDLEMAKKFAALPFPITFSILPHLRHSLESAEIAHAHNRQVMVHLPMEPQGYPKMKPGPGALLLSMSDQSVLQTLRDALQTSPHAVGINNHMGSRFTERANLMKVVIEEVGHRGLFFLDSATSPKSVAIQLAQDLRIPHIRRDVFLDHAQTEKAVTAQLKQLIQKARIQGTAVAIGHPHDVTLRVLQGAAEHLRREGIEVVSAGDLVVRN
jgi:uncharacterized protein